MTPIFVLRYQEIFYISRFFNGIFLIVRDMDGVREAFKVENRQFSWGVIGTS